MDVVFAIFMFLCYIALFATMIVAAAAHNWFAFVGWLLAWIFATVAAVVAANK